VTPTEYWAERSRLSNELRSLREERRMVRAIFHQAQDPYLQAKGNQWRLAMYEKDAAICRKILDLDSAYYGGTV
jgi:ribosomal protein L19E